MKLRASVKAQVMAAVSQESLQRRDPPHCNQRGLVLLSIMVVLVIAFQIVVETKAAKKAQGSMKAIGTMQPHVVNAMRTQKSIEKRTNEDECSSRTTNRDENLSHDENATSNNTTTRGSDVAKSPIFRKTKTRGKRKLDTIHSNDDNDSGPNRSKRLRTGGYDESTRDIRRHHGNNRSTGSKEDLGNHTDTLVGQAAGNPTHDNNANVASRGLSVPLRRSARKRKMRILGG